MDALAVNEVPRLLRDDTSDIRGKVVIFAGGPGAHTPDRDLGDLFSSGEFATGVCRQHGHIHACGCQSLSHLMHMRLDTAHEWEVAWSHEQQAHGTYGLYL